MPPPKAIVCYICGRQYMKHSFGIHEEQCRELFEKREACKPPKERRALPPSPYTTRPTGGGSNSSSKGASNNNNTSTNISGNSNSSSYSSSAALERGFSSTLGRNKYDIVDYDIEVNANSAALMLQTCPNCSRSFNDVAYPRHLKICKKVFCSKRKPYDSKKARAKGTELMQYYTPGNSSGKPTSSSISGSMSLTSALRSAPTNTAGSSTRLGARASVGGRVGGVGGKQDWRSQSEQFRAAMRAARQATQEDSGSSRSAVQVPRGGGKGVSGGISSRTGGGIGGPSKGGGGFGGGFSTSNEVSRDNSFASKGGFRGGFSASNEVSKDNTFSNRFSSKGGPSSRGSVGIGSGGGGGGGGGFSASNEISNDNAFALNSRMSTKASLSTAFSNSNDISGDNGNAFTIGRSQQRAVSLRTELLADGGSGSTAAVKGAKAVRAIGLTGVKTTDLSAYSSRETTPRLTNGGGGKLNATADSSHLRLSKSGSVGGLPPRNQASYMNDLSVEQLSLELERRKKSQNARPGDADGLVSSKMSSMCLGASSGLGKGDAVNVVSSSYMKDVARIATGGGDKGGNLSSINNTNYSISNNGSSGSSNIRRNGTDDSKARLGKGERGNILSAGGTSDDSIYKTSSNSYGSFYKK